MKGVFSFLGRLLVRLILDLLFGTEVGWIILLLTAAVVVAAVVRARRAGARRRDVGPKPREVWWAEVPFEDGPGTKDRPCLVLWVRGRNATVAKITSKHHDRPKVVALPRGMVVDRKGRASWLELDELRKVPLADFRRRIGELDDRTWAVAQRTVS